jgi:hypothetical protein
MNAKFFGFKNLASNIKMSLVMFLAQVSMNTYHFLTASQILSRAINFGRQCHFKIWLDCHKLKNFPCLIIPTPIKCQKMRKKK